MAHHRIEFDQQCKSCNGTGIYVGFGEKDGFGVVCHTCNGTGCKKSVIEYDDFDGKKVNPNVKHVIQTNPGISVGIGNGHTCDDFGGISYDDWLAGKKFEPGSEMRKFTCPAWWYQNANPDLKPYWKECGWGTFSKCHSFHCKEKCWERWDGEFGNNDV